MRWDEEAEARLQKAPIFVRKKVIQQVEDYVLSQGREEVTADDISAAQGIFGRGTRGAGAHAAHHHEDIPVTAEEIGRLEKMVAQGDIKEGLDSKFYNIKLCGGVTGCSLSVIDDKKVVQIMLEVIGETNLAGNIAAKLAGRPVLAHHKFKAGVAGCPNSCSEPQIKDFAVVGQRRPKVGEIPCSGCSLCVKVCRENGLVLKNKEIEINYENCLNCGLCIEACPKGVLLEEQVGYKVVIGGRLGRHPRLAETIVDFADDEQLRQSLVKCIEVFKQEGRPGERFSHLVDRLGMEELTKRLF